MVTTLTQDDIAVFGTDPTTVKEQPGTTNYANGVDVRYTAPAKWWNWFWNIITSWFTHHKADNESIITEEENLLESVDITPSDSDTHQLAKSIGIVAETNAEDYDLETVVEDEVEHYVNRPYVTGRTIVLPATELL